MRDQAGFNERLGGRTCDLAETTGMSPEGVRGTVEAAVTAHGTVKPEATSGLHREDRAGADDRRLRPMQQRLRRWRAAPVRGRGRERERRADPSLGAVV